jgi:hypothetical protein
MGLFLTDRRKVVLIRDREREDEIAGIVAAAGPRTAESDRTAFLQTLELRG